MSLRPRRLILPLIVCALAVAAFFGWRERSGPEPIAFKTTLVTRGTLTQTVTATGELQPIASVEVSSQISGLIKEVLVDYNSRIKAGDVLALIDPASYETRLCSAEAELANTLANHRLVSLNAARIHSLYERKLVAQQELDQSVALLAQAEAQRLIRAAAVEIARVDLARCTITAPIDGLVLDRQAAMAGKTIAASLNAPVLFVLVEDLSKLQIKAAISEADIGNIREGQSVAFTVDAFPNKSFRGTVRQIRNNPAVQSNVVTYATIIDVGNDSLMLKPGMTANVAVTVREKPDTLMVTNSALRTRVPDDLKLPAQPIPVPVGAAQSSSSASTSADPFKTLLAEIGYNEADGRPNREQISRVRALATERGIVIPEQRRGGRGPSVVTEAESVRTLYVPSETPDGTRARPIEVRLGITDGINTEVIAGLEGKAEVITGLVDATSKATAPASNPFSPGGGGPRRF